MLGWLGLVIVSVFIFTVWFLFCSLKVIQGGRVSERLVGSGVFTGAQLILAEILLGQMGKLNLGWVLVLHALVSGGILAGLVLFHRDPGGHFLDPLSEFRKEFSRWWREVQGWEIWVLLFLNLILLVWLTSAAYLLPPRGMDDVYHLPPVYQYIQDERISILPLELRPQFAYPENGELLFLWVLLFVRDVRMVDLVQVFFGFWGCLVLYSLAVQLTVQRRLAFFLSLLFPLIPLVAGQMGSAYIDLLAAVFLLSALVFAVGFWTEGRLGYFYLAGLAGGLLIGMKYSMVFFILAIQPLLWYPLWIGWGNKKYRHAVFYLILVVVCGGYWYVRNLLVLGSLLGPPVS